MQIVWDYFSVHPISASNGCYTWQAVVIKPFLNLPFFFYEVHLETKGDFVRPDASILVSLSKYNEWN